MTLPLVTIPYSRLDPGNEVARAYMVDPDRALHLFQHDYRDPRALRPLLDAQLALPRPDFSAELAEYNATVGGSTDNAKRLKDCACVISGQQVGLLYGPAYTTFKLFTVINAARELERELGMPVVPVFWVESEDHDFDEVNRFFWNGRRFRIEGDVAPRTPVSEIEIDFAPFLADVREALGNDSEAWSLVETEGSVARAHVRNLARLVAGEGVVFVEPALLREPLAEFAERIGTDGDVLDAALTAETGFERPLSPPNGAYLFDATGPRQRLARGARVPERWSTDVVSRVLVQNAAFPVLMAVCGPSEIQYWSQLKSAHEHFGIPMPAVLPRDAATLIEKSVARDAAKLGLDLEDIVRGIAVRPLPSEGDPIAERLRRLAAEAGELIAAVDSGELDLPGNTEKPFRRSTTRLHGELEKLATRLENARDAQTGTGQRRFEQVLSALRPRDGLQERTHSLFPYLVRHGPELATALRESFDPFEIGHYLVRL